MNIVALIPARAGSRRIPGKNIKPLGGKPLIQWTIEAAQESGIFSRIVISTENGQLKGAASRMGAEFVHRPERFATDDSPDIEWVRHALSAIMPQPDAFAILRPTSPFRTADTIRLAWAQFRIQEADSMRGVRPVHEHPAKVWRLEDDFLSMTPAVKGHTGQAPWHSSPTQVLPAYVVQTGGLEIAWTETVRRYDSISGDRVVPFFLDGAEGFDINTPEDWERAEAHAQTLLARVP